MQKYKNESRAYMAKDNFIYVNAVVLNEGLTYAVLCYSDFAKVKDKHFHSLIAEFKNAHSKLQGYIDEQHDKQLELIENR